MKKVIISALIVLGLTGSAFAAGFVGGEYEFEKSRKSNDTANTVEFFAGYKFQNNVKVDVKFEGTQAVQSKEIDNILEARAKFEQLIYGPLKLNLRVSVGEHFTQAGNFPFYTIEPGLQLAANDKLGLNASYRYRNAFDEVKYKWETLTFNVGPYYKVTANDEVGVKYFRKTSDDQTEGFKVGYTHSF